MKKLLLPFFLLIFISNLSAQIDVVKFSEEFLLSVKMKETVTEKLDTLAAISIEQMTYQLQHDSAKLAFWLNMYNAFIQIKANEHPNLIKEKRDKFFSTRFIKIAQHLFSFDDIEHTILRKSKWKYGLGYIPSYFTPKYLNKLQVEKLDKRIHFALNCGAKACPPIAFYSPSKIEEQLKTAEASFIASNSSYNPEENTLYITELLSWFRGDFGGKKGIKHLTKKQNVVPFGENPKIEFTDYDWSLSLKNYVD